MTANDSRFCEGSPAKKKDSPTKFAGAICGGIIAVRNDPLSLSGYLAVAVAAAAAVAAGRLRAGEIGARRRMADADCG